MAFLLEHAAAGLFLDPGLRKTSTTLGAFLVLLKEGVAKRALVIAPMRVCHSVWPREVKKWVEFSDLRVELLHGKDKENALKRDADIYLINPEGLPWLLGVTKERKPGCKKAEIKYDWARFKTLNADTLIIDEISRFKHTSNDRFRMIKPVLPKFQRRWGLTGSPAPNGLLDLFGIMYCIDLGRALGSFITHYRSAYFMPTGFGGFDWKLQKGAEQMIYERIAPTVFRLSGNDYLKLPKLVENIVYVDLPDDVRKIYDTLEADFITQIHDSVITASNAGAASTKLCQIANGGLYLARETNEQGTFTGPREWKNLHTVKVEAVQEILEELSGSPAIITYDFEHDLDRLRQALGKDSAVIGGGVSAKKSDAIADAWNRGELPWLLGQPTSMALGLNLQDGNAQHIIVHSMIWDYELYDQLIRRLLRSGNMAKVIFVHLILARDTVDEAKLLAMRRKSKTQGDFLDAMLDYTKGRLKALGLSSRPKRPSKK